MATSLVVIFLAIVYYALSSPISSLSPMDSNTSQSDHSNPTNGTIFSASSLASSALLDPYSNRPHAPYLYRYNNLNCFVNFTTYGHWVGWQDGRGVLCVYRSCRPQYTSDFSSTGPVTRPASTSSTECVEVPHNSAPFAAGIIIGTMSVSHTPF